MTRRLPVVPTLVVLLAVATMIALGFWQLGRLREKETLIAQGQRAMAMNAETAWPRDETAVERSLYRHSTLDCARVLALDARAGTNARGQPGWAHVARCSVPGIGEVPVVLGWSRTPDKFAWNGGRVGGIIAPGPRLVATTRIPGLEANAVPDPANLPNNHLSYAVQWFFFAATALVIYALAVRKRWRAA
jgi:surfeit locus 1 family protein